MSPFLALEDITFSYPEKVIFEDFSLALYPEKKIGLMGPNGAGKTTLLRLLLGLERPQKGLLYFQGQPCRNERDLRELRKQVGLVFQDPDDQLFCPTVAEDLAFGPLNLGLPREEVKKRVQRTLKLLGLEGFEDRVTYRLSGGEKRLVALGTILTMSPKLILLDEPTGDLDPQNQKKLINILKKLPVALFIVSHERSFLRAVCQEIWYLENGKLQPIS